jgi:hydrogenase expression/formation protein HypE
LGPAYAKEKEKLAAGGGQRRMKISLSYGSGGQSTKDLIDEVFAKHFSNPILDRMEDGAVLDVPVFRIAFTTDSFVVTPLFFPGGDIGKLAVCGTVNDLLMMGAMPKYLTAGFIIEEGLDYSALEAVVQSMKTTCSEAGVNIVAGDTKVIQGQGGLYINTSGVGFLPPGREISASKVEPGDVVILSGTLGEHHSCILSRRMNIENNIQSDCAPLNQMVENLLSAGVTVRAMRDVTRGGLATILNEIADASNVEIVLHEDKIPLSREVKSFCEVLGLDPLYMGNEGKMVSVVPKEEQDRALEIIQGSKYGKKAAVIAEVKEKGTGMVTLETSIGGKRILDILQGEGLPRIC